MHYPVTIFRLVQEGYFNMGSVVVRSGMSVGMQVLAFVNTDINVADQFFTSMCFESKKWVSMLVPCVLELYLELRRFMSMGKCWNT